MRTVQAIGSCKRCSPARPTARARALATRAEGSLGGRAVLLLPSVGAEQAEARQRMASARGGRWPPADVGRAAGGAMARHAGRQEGRGRQAGRQAGRRLRAERRAHAPLPTAAAVGGGWVARQAAPYSALNDWHGLFCCRPRFPRLRAVLAVARTARACCCARRLLPHASWHARRGDGGGGGGGGGSRERARVQGGCKASRGAARSQGSYRWFMENSDIVCAAAAPLGAR